MISYETFKEMVMTQISDYLPEEYRNREVLSETVQKINRTKDSIYLAPQDETGQIPIIYIDDMYENYVRTEDFPKVMRICADYMCISPDVKKAQIKLQPKEEMKQQIVFQLINHDQNTELLQSLPHRDMEDLSIIYRLIIEKGQNGVSSAVVDKKIAEELGVTEEELFTLAKENTERIFPSVVCPLSELLRKRLIEEGMSEELYDVMLADVPENNGMYIITNQNQMNGAAAILFDRNLDKLAEVFQTDVYLLPSSIHEMIAVSADSVKPEILAEMVAEVNQYGVCLEEQLSNQVYLYDRNKRTISLATDTLNKELEHHVAETAVGYEPERKEAR